MMRILARFRGSQSGSVAVEFAVVGLLFMMLSVGVFEFGRALNVRSDMGHAVDVAARTLMINAAATNQAVATALRDAFRRGDPARLQIAVSNETVAGASYRRIQTTYPLQLRLVGFGNTLLTFTIVRRIPTG